MLQLIRKYTIDALRRRIAAGPQRSSSDSTGLHLSARGQVAMVLIVVAALGLVLYAVVLNYNRVSGQKNQTMLAAQKSAGFMASFISSYAQQLSEENLKGGLSYCKSTSFFSALLKALILIALAIAIPGGSIGAALEIAAIMATAGAIMDAVLIQPTITNQWNRMMKKLSAEGMAMEYGIQQALRTVVGDTVPFPDLLDFDMDGSFGWETVTDSDGNTVVTATPRDTISRFNIYYTERLKSVKTPDVAGLKEFAKQLKDFLYYSDAEPGGLENNPISFLARGWGLHNPAPSGACVVAECDPGCLPLRDACCDNEATPCDPPDNPTCDFPSSPGPTVNCNNTTYMPAHPFVFDPFYEQTSENIVNTRYSLRENIGRDDESTAYNVRPDFPDWHNTPATPPQLGDSSPQYRAEDTTGFWKGDNYRPSVFSLLYMIRDIGIGLEKLPSDYSYPGYQCYWQDAVPADPVVTCNMGRYDHVYRRGGELAPLRLGPIDLRSGGGTVRDLGAGGFPDIVSTPDFNFLPANECGIDPASDTAKQGWKPGIDRFCSTAYPYHVGCEKHNYPDDPDDLDGCWSEPDDAGITHPVDCLCGETGAAEAEQFPEDMFDDLYYGLEEFMGWAKNFIEKIDSGQAVLLRKTMETWYGEEVADWLEPECTISCAAGDDTCCPASYTKRQRKGTLYEWRDNMKWFYGLLDAWLTESYAARAGSQCLGGISEAAPAVWCVPPVGNNCDAPADEIATFNINGDSVRGDIEDVVACLNWNANDDGGNDAKFEACRAECAKKEAGGSSAALVLQVCQNLPRSLVSQEGVYAGVYDREAFDNEVAAVAEAEANAACPSPTPPEVQADPDATQFLEWVTESATAAENQVIKLRQRYVFLKHFYDEAVRMRAIFGEAVDRFDEFLNNNTGFAAAPSDLSATELGAGYIEPSRSRAVKWSAASPNFDPEGIDENVYEHYKVDSPAELLIKMRSEDLPEEKGDLSSVAVYVWRGDDVEKPRTLIGGGTTTDGYVHAVKVEVRAPKRCNGACGTDQWPWIRTKTKRWGTKRCYYLEEYSGVVKVRVIRFDEPTNPKSQWFRFANNISFPGLSTAHPDTTYLGGAGAVFNTGGDCYQQMDPVVRGIGEALAKNPAGPQTLHHAFMLNTAPNFTSSDSKEVAYRNCWTAVHDDLLKYGIHSESCAQYYWDSDKQDMAVKFIPCDEDFLQGNN